MTMHAAPIADALQIPHLICNRFDVDEHGRLTGAIARPIIWGIRKAQAVENFCTANGVELQYSYFYADGAEDLPLMRKVGHPARSIRAGLAAAAAEHGWPVLRASYRWRRRPGVGLNT